MKRILFVLAMISPNLMAQQVAPQPPPSPEQMQAAIQACEASQYNANGVTLPEFVPGQRHPKLTKEQWQLIHACREAGILPKFGHHHHHQAQ